MRKIFAILTSLNLIFSFSPFVYAQTASTSGLVATGNTYSISSSGTQSASNSFNDSFVNSSITPQNSYSGPDISSIVPSFDTPAPSAVLGNGGNGKKWDIKQSKNDFRGDEDYSVNLDGLDPTNLATISIIDPLGNQIPVDYQKFTTSTGTNLQIAPPKNFRPGKYTLTVTDNSENITTQDFTWGVLAINTDKSIYLPGEMTNFALAVLGNDGEMVCDANVSLTITDPIFQTKTLSTANGTIIVNPQCKLHNFSLVPDYYATYSATTVGTYNLNLTATTANGTKSITDSFQVQDSVPFDVQRITATRIYPPAAYPVNFHIKVNQDFKGQIIEYVPTSFDISASTGSGSLPFDVEQIATPINSNSQIVPLSIALPFKGTYTETLGFGQHLLDPQERDLYASFGLAGHDGLDFAMPIGTPVLAADDGTVVMAGGVIYGTTVVIQHSWGRSYYGHLSKVEVKLGQKVSKGDEIALSGNSGIVTGAHLHFGIKFNLNNPQNGFYGKVDPSQYLGIAPIVSFSSYDNVTKAIVWNVDVKKGDNLNLSYSFKVPPKSPEFYTLGPLSFVKDQNVVFQEARVWQLAVDATVVTIITTSYSDPCGSNCYTVPTDWNNSNYSIEAIGGGGGGGSGTNGGSGNNQGRGGGGGGGGGEYRKITQASGDSYTAGNSISLSVGTGGPGNTGANGTAGNNTTWNGGGKLTAIHGNAGGWSNSASGGSAGSGGTGGTGAQANFNGGAGGAGRAASGNAGGGGAGGGGGGGTTAVGGTATGGGTSTAGTAGGAGGTASGGTAGTANGGTGGNGTVWTDTSSSATGGAGGGGGGGNGGSTTGNSGIQGGNGGNYGGGGGGGGGGGRSASGLKGGNGIDGVIVVTYVPISVTTEFGYRWRSDDGNETTGTSLAAEETDITDLHKNTNIRLRFLIYNQGGSNASAQTFRLDYAALSGTCATSSYAALPTSAGGPFITATTANYTDGSASTNVSSGPAVIIDPGGGSFTAGKLLSTSNQAASITLNSKTFTEIEWNFQATSTATEGQAYCFRVTNAGTAIDSYSVYAQATIHVSGPTLDQLLRHGDWFNSSGVRQSFTF